MHVEVLGQLSGVGSPLPPWVLGRELSLSGLVLNTLTNLNHLASPPKGFLKVKTGT